MLQYKELLELCIQALDTFNHENESVEEYIKVFLKKKKNLDDGDHTFIVEVFSGCVQYRKLLSVVVDGFYMTEGKNCLHTDTNLYRILCYMIMFRLDELGISNLNKFVNTQSTNKMYRFLKFFIDDDNLPKWIRDEWCKQYDNIFVDEEIMKTILRWKEDLESTVLRLDDIISNRIIKAKPTSPTRQKPFSLTKPKPRSIPVPDRIPSVPKHKPVPKHLFNVPKDNILLQKKHLENQRKAEEALLVANEQQFLCAHPEKSLKAKVVMQKIMDEQEKKLNFNMRHMKPVPQSIKEERPIKMNAAAIMREAALYKKKEKEELIKLEGLLAGNKDAAEFQEWHKIMHEKDKNEKMVEVAHRRIKGKLCREEAILARQNKVEANKELVSHLKFESAKMMQEYLAMRLDEEKQMRQLVEQITDGHHNTQEAQMKLRDYKRKIVQEVNAESREMMRRALEDAEEDMRRKSRLIQEIRAMESVPVNRQKLVDFTSTAGYAFLSEMSIVELKERLCLLRDAQEQEAEERRDAIIKVKQARNEALMETLARISTHRNEKRKSSSIRQQNEENQRKLQEQNIKEDKTLQALNEQLEQKKEERIRKAQEMALKPSKESTIRTKGLIRQKKDLENMRWRQLELSQQRMAEMRTRGTAPGSGKLGISTTNRSPKTALKIA